jgi:pentatricopeptide repeat protein
VLAFGLVTSNHNAMGILVNAVAGCLSSFGTECIGSRSVLLLLASFAATLAYCLVWWAATASSSAGEPTAGEGEESSEAAQPQQAVLYAAPKEASIQSDGVPELCQVASKLLSPEELVIEDSVKGDRDELPKRNSLDASDSFSDENSIRSLWADLYTTSDTAEPTCGFDDAWPSGAACTGAEATITADANSVLEAALASGSAKLADAALATGVRLCSSTWLTKACGQLQAVGIPLMPGRALELVRIFGQDHRADLAVDLWHAQCDELGMDPADGLDSEPPPCPELYSAVLETCARAGDFETAAQAASSTGWRVPACRHGQVAFLALSRWYARRQDVSQSLMCYEAVRAVSGNADLATHRAVLVASVRSADMQKADTLFKDLVSSGITPDGATYSAMICGHCSAGNVEKAMHYFRSLRERGIVPTSPLFDAILDGCTWMNMPSLIEQVLAEMEATGVRPSTSTLSILVRLHGMNRDTEQALAVFNDFPKKHGLKLDGHAYGTLVSVCLKNDSYDTAWNAFDRMSKAGCRAHARIYEAVIAASLRHGQLDNAVAAVYEALGIPPEDLDESAVIVPRMRLQAKIIEDVFRLIGRRRQACRLGAPLLRRLRAARIEVSEDLTSAILQHADTPDEQPRSELHQRRALHLKWRNCLDGAHKDHHPEQGACDEVA